MISFAILKYPFWLTLLKPLAWDSATVTTQPQALHAYNCINNVLNCNKIVIARIWQDLKIWNTMSTIRIIDFVYSDSILVDLENQTTIQYSKKMRCAKKQTIIHQNRKCSTPRLLLILRLNLYYYCKSSIRSLPLLEVNPCSY